MLFRGHHLLDHLFSFAIFPENIPESASVSPAPRCRYRHEQAARCERLCTAAGQGTRQGRGRGFLLAEPSSFWKKWVSRTGRGVARARAMPTDERQHLRRNF